MSSIVYQPVDTHGYYTQPRRMRLNRNENVFIVALGIITGIIVASAIIIGVTMLITKGRLLSEISRYPFVTIGNLANTIALGCGFGAVTGISVGFGTGALLQAYVTPDTTLGTEINQGTLK